MPEQFACAPQVGTPIEQDWAAFSVWLSTPTVATDKRAAGAWCPAALPDGIVKNGSGPVSLLVFDVDDCGPDGIDRSVTSLAEFAGLVIPTFSATPAKPKHRIVLRLSRPLTPDEFPPAWRQTANALEDDGVAGLDRGCKNLNRLYFASVCPAPGAWLGARELAGEPLDVARLLAAASADEAASSPSHARGGAVGPIRHHDAYVRGALERARRAVEDASEGERHGTLLNEAFSLARLELDEFTIRGALLESFVARAGAHRRHEGERAIRDAVTARARKAGA